LFDRLLMMMICVIILWTTVDWCGWQCIFLVSFWADDTNIPVLCK